MHEPVIILGAARSGTTFLARSALARLDPVCYWGEPNHVWMHGHAYQSHDCLYVKDANDSVCDHVRRRFKAFHEKSGKKILIEKTPSNCLRIPLVRKVFPKARYIHLIRDGRSVVRSAAKEWQGSGQKALDSQNLRSGTPLQRVRKGLQTYIKMRERIADLTDLLELPAYAPRLLNFIRRNLSKSGDFPWGPRFPGMVKYRQTHSLLETCAEQWRWQVQFTLDGLQKVDPACCYQLHFEELMKDPRGHLSSIANWIGCSFDKHILDDICISVQKNRSAEINDPLSDLSADLQTKVHSIIDPLQSKFGYPTADYSV